MILYSCRVQNCNIFLVSRTTYRAFSRDRSAVGQSTEKKFTKAVARSERFLRDVD